LGNGAAQRIPRTILDFDHPRSASSTAVSSKSALNANRIRLSGRRLANATPAEIAETHRRLQIAHRADLPSLRGPLRRPT